MTLLFAGAIGLGAFLLFVIQPEVGKLVLPLLGGTPAVWNTCLVFFQLALLAGYLYAHLLGRVALRTQVALHLTLMAAAAIVLPIAVRGASLETMAERPALWLFGTLVARVGAPYVVAAATAPLLQRWWASTRASSAGDPYFLYAASNAGSLLALLAYPVLIEPAMPLAQQARIWTIGYALLMALLAAAGLAAWRHRAPLPARVGSLPLGHVETSRLETSIGASNLETSGLEVGEVEANSREPHADAPERFAPVTWRRRGRWFLLSAVPVVIMLGATTYITTDVAAVPLLWVLPLSVYLSTFILAFARRQLVPPRAASALLAIAVLPPLLAVALHATGPWLPLLVSHLAALFFAALVCHGALARDRPHSSYLTEFYLWIAAGGALGGLLTNLAAPLLFSSILEYPIGLIAACLLRPELAAPAPQPAPQPASHSVSQPASHSVLPPAEVPEPRAAGWRRADLLWIAAPALVAAAGAFLQPKLLADWTPGIALAPPVMLATLQWHRPRRFALAIALSLLAVATLSQSPHQDLFAARNFFGVVRVRATTVGENDRAHPVHMLLHGHILHGMQATTAAWRLEPASYYGRSGPIGQLFDESPGRDTRTRVGVVGLGIGALIAYARPHERWIFFDINPTVVDIATDRRYFTYLADARAPYDLVLGEGRLAVAEQPDRSFDILVLDAFSSDAIPTHLVTREAIAMYFRKLTPGGLLIVNVSNRFVSLQPVLGAIARAEGLAGRQRNFVPGSADVDLFPAEWVVLARDEASLGVVAGDERWERLPETVRAWSDDYSSLVPVLKWQR